VLAAGMDDYLTKPIPVRSLEVALGRFINQSRDLSKTLDGQLPGKPADNDTRTAGSLRTLGAQSSPAVEQVLDREVSRSLKVIDLFLKLVPAQMDGLLEAAKKADSEDVRQRSHKLKGGCCSIGATAMAELCELLQHAAEQGDVADAVTRAERIKALYVPTSVLLESERAQKLSAAQ